MRNLGRILFYSLLFVILPGIAMAEGADATGPGIGAGIAVGLAGLGCGLGQGQIPAPLAQLIGKRFFGRHRGLLSLHDG